MYNIYIYCECIIVDYGLYACNHKKKKLEKPTNPNANHTKETYVREASRMKCRCGVWSVKCGV